MDKKFFEEEVVMDAFSAELIYDIQNGKVFGGWEAFIEGCGKIWQRGYDNGEADTVRRGGCKVE
jgi:hypothetical protein